jgi:hypothetical protein
LLKSGLSWQKILEAEFVEPESLGVWKRSASLSPVPSGNIGSIWRNKIELGTPEEAIQCLFAVQNISIDYGIMESKNVCL